MAIFFEVSTAGFGSRTDDLATVGLEGSLAGVTGVAVVSVVGGWVVVICVMVGVVVVVVF